MAQAKILLINTSLAVLRVRMAKYYLPLEKDMAQVMNATIKRDKRFKTLRGLLCDNTTSNFANVRLKL